MARILSHRGRIILFKKKKFTLKIIELLPCTWKARPWTTAKGSDRLSNRGFTTVRIYFFTPILV